MTISLQMQLIAAIDDSSHLIPRLQLVPPAFLLVYIIYISICRIPEHYRARVIIIKTSINKDKNLI